MSRKLKEFHDHLISVLKRGAHHGMEAVIDEDESISAIYFEVGRDKEDGEYLDIELSDDGTWQSFWLKGLAGKESKQRTLYDLSKSPGDEL